MSSPTFAEWQRSRGITPWTTVHHWSEWTWQTRHLRRGLDAMCQALADAFTPAVRALGDAFAALSALLPQAGRLT